MLQEIRARERDMERIQAELDALRSGAAARRGVKRHLPPPVVEEAKRGQPTTTASAREAEDLLEACLGLSEAVLGVSFSHVSSTLVPSRDGLIIKRYDVRGRAAASMSFMLLLQVQEEAQGEGELAAHETVVRSQVRVPAAYSDQLRPLTRMLEETKGVQLFLSRLAEFAELAEAREALWRHMKHKYAARVTLPHGLSSTHLWFTPIRDTPDLQFAFIWEINFTDELDIKTVVDLVPRVSFTVPDELAWLKDTSQHFKTLASRKGVQDALETIFAFASS